MIHRHLPLADRSQVSVPRDRPLPTPNPLMEQVLDALRRELAEVVRKAQQPESKREVR